MKLFSDVCVAKFGHLTTVWDWADDQKLLPITNPKALAVFAGKPNRDGKMLSFAGGGVPGSGKAWAVDDPAGRFVLATRLDPESCVVWAQKADPGEVDAAFAKMVAQAVAPGVEVKQADDRTVNVPDGAVHIRASTACGRGTGAQQLCAGGGDAGQPTGGLPFQAMLETQRLVERDRPDQSDGPAGAARLETPLLFCASARYRVVRQVEASVTLYRIRRGPVTRRRRARLKQGAAVMRSVRS